MVEDTLHAKRYSQAVFEIAKESNDLDKWKNDLAKIASLAQNPEFVAVMENPRFAFEEKAKLLNSQLKGISQKALNLSYILTSRGRFSLIIEVYNGYQKLLDDYRGIAKAEVTTAIPLDETERNKIAQQLGKITGKKVEIIEKVNPKIIGGVVAKVGGKIIDGSTSTQLSILKNELIKAGREG